MKFFQSLSPFLIVCFFFNCSTPYKLQKQSPLKFHKIEVRKWSLKGQNNESGISMYIILPSDIKTALDSVYYNNSKTVINKGKNKNTYFAHFKVVSKPAKDAQFPFDLKSNECVVSYVESGKTKYYKYSGVKEKS